MNDVIVAGLYAVVIFVSLRGAGYLFGFGLKSRNKCWASENYLRSQKQYREYFD